jgi:hypothetical protein
VPPIPPASDETLARIERIKALCDELDAAQNDTHRYTDVIELIRRVDDAFRRTFGTRDRKL